jgi:hypothetical protein
MGAGAGGAGFLWHCGEGEIKPKHLKANEDG